MRSDLHQRHSFFDSRLHLTVYWPLFKETEFTNQGGKFRRKQENKVIPVFLKNDTSLDPLFYAASARVQSNGVMVMDKVHGPRGCSLPNRMYGFQIFKKIFGFFGFFQIFFIFFGFFIFFFIFFFLIPDFFLVYDDFMNKKGFKH